MSKRKIQDEFKEIVLLMVRKQSTRAMTKLTSLLQNGFDVNLVEDDDSHKTLLHYAAMSNDYDIVKLLIDHDADINIQDISKNTPLNIASFMNSKLEILQLLVDHRANVNAPNHSGMTPLHFASLCNNLDILKLLIEHGANINAIDNKKNTPLMLSLKASSLSTLAMLVKEGANIDIRDEDGRSALLYTKDESSDQNIVRILMGDPQAIHEALVTKTLGEITDDGGI